MAIMEAAVALFARQGFDGTTVPEIARRAGVATGSIYLYFPTKEALVNTVFAERKQAMLDGFVAAIGGGGDLEARFRRAWRALVAFALAHPDDFRFFELHHHESYIDAASRAVGDRLMGAAVGFMREITAAYSGNKAIGPEAQVSLVWGALVGLMKGADQGYLRLDPQLVDAAGTAMWLAITASITPPSTILLQQERGTP